MFPVPQARWLLLQPLVTEGSVFGSLFSSHPGAVLVPNNWTSAVPYQPTSLLMTQSSLYEINAGDSLLQVSERFNSPILS